MLTLYFAGAISGGRNDVALYREIIAALENDGYRVLAGAVAAEHVTASGEALDSRAISSATLPGSPSATPSSPRSRCRRPRRLRDRHRSLRFGIR